jgi:hypothetical protein
MAADFIKITRTDSSATHAPKILNAVAQVRQALTTLQEIVDIGYHNFTTNPDDFTAFEALFGIPEGQGSAVFTLINGTRGVLRGEFQNANALDLISRVG